MGALEHPIGPGNARHLPIATDGVIRFRLFAPADVDGHIAGEDHATVRFLSGGLSTRASTLTWILRNLRSWETEGSIRCFAVERCEDGKLVGMVEANLALPGFRPGVANLTYGLYPPFRGQGYATRAVNLMLRYLRGHSEADVALVQTSPENPASAAVALHAGFHSVGARISHDGDALEMFILPLRAH